MKTTQQTDYQGVSIKNIETYKLQAWKEIILSMTTEEIERRSLLVSMSPATDENNAFQELLTDEYLRRKRENKNRDVVQEWLPRFQGIDVQDAVIETFSRRADYHISFRYKKHPWEAEKWGDDPNKLYIGGTHFTSKAKAKQFIKEVKNANK